MFFPDAMCCQVKTGVTGSKAIHICIRMYVRSMAQKVLRQNISGAVHWVVGAKIIGVHATTLMMRCNVNAWVMRKCALSAD
jgi:hypothetical protein